MIQAWDCGRKGGYGGLSILLFLKVSLLRSWIAKGFEVVDTW